MNPAPARCVALRQISSIRRRDTRTAFLRPTPDFIRAVVESATVIVFAVVAGAVGAVGTVLWAGDRGFEMEGWVAAAGVVGFAVEH